MKTILFIEDNPCILDNLREYFELMGYKVLLANCGEKGIEIAKSNFPDLIVCDMVMPDLNGNDVLSSLLASPKTSFIPFIFSTSKSENIDRKNALNHGATDYIIKPYELESLLSLINKCL
jgi:CheY-like chemotaxis protein